MNKTSDEKCKLFLVIKRIKGGPDSEYNRDKRLGYFHLQQ